MRDWHIHRHPKHSADRSGARGDLRYGEFFLTHQGWETYRASLFSSTDHSTWLNSWTINGLPTIVAKQAKWLDDEFHALCIRTPGPAWWESPRFQAVCMAWSWFCQSGVITSRPPGFAECSANESHWATEYGINRIELR